MSHVTSLLRRVRLRIAAASAVEDLQRGLAAGSGASLAVLAAARLGVETGGTGTALYAGLVAAAAVPVAGLFVRRWDESALASAADERLGLRERISTALWARADGGTGALAPLVAGDADAAAARVAGRDISRAFRPRLLRRPLVVAGCAFAACTGILLWQPAAEAVESPAKTAARLAEQDRVAQVARKLEQEAKRVEAAATENKQAELAKLAAEVRKQAAAMQREPPPKEQALTTLNKLSDHAKGELQRKMGLKEAGERTPEMSERDKALSDLLQQLSAAGLESLQKDLAKLEERLRKDGGQDGKQGGEDGAGKDGRPTAEDLRALAERMDALRRAVQRAEEAGAEELAKSLRTIGNEDLLEKIAERLRELAAKMDQRGYQGLEGEDAGESMDLGEMSREELEQMLKDLEEMAGMEDLSQMLREGGRESRGGKRMRLGSRGNGGGT